MMINTYEVMRMLLGQKQCPRTGGGVHTWLFHAASCLRNLSEKSVVDFLEYATEDCGRYVPDTEIYDAVMNARATGRGHSFDGCSSGRQSRSGKIPLDEERIAELRGRQPAFLPTGVPESGCGCQCLDSCRCRPDLPATISDILCLLFSHGPEPLLGIGFMINEQFYPITPTDANIPLIHRMQYLIPNPLLSKDGGMKVDGSGMSLRAKSNVGRRHNIVVEFDQHPLDLQLVIIEELACEYDLLMVLHSGGKSYHAWFDVYDLSEDEQVELMQRAESLGADRMMWTKSQAARLPYGIRRNRYGRPLRRQEVIYLKPRT